MNGLKINSIIGMALGVVLLGLPLAVSAKDKDSTGTAQTDFIWLDAEVVAALFSPAAFWCAQPLDDSCVFFAIGLGESETGYMYDAVGFWDETTIIKERRHARIDETGLLCERAELVLKSIRVTDHDNVPVSTERLSEVRAELSEIYSQPQPETCFRYTLESEEGPHLITQYEIGPEGEPYDPLVFDISFVANAQTSYTLRWE